MNDMVLLDANGYPTDEAIQQIENWAASDPAGLIEFVREIWWMPDWGFELKGKRVLRLELHTGGWSGNESIINALNKTIFWMMCWEKTIRGGHYYFRVQLNLF